MQLSLSIEVCIGLEKILNFDNVELYLTLWSLGCIGCGHVRSGVSNGTDCRVEIVMWYTTYVDLLKGHIVTPRCNSAWALRSASDWRRFWTLTMLSQDLHSKVLAVYDVVWYVSLTITSWVLMFCFKARVVRVCDYPRDIFKSLPAPLLGSWICLWPWRAFEVWYLLAYLATVFFFSDGLVRVKLCSLYIHGMYMGYCGA